MEVEDLITKWKDAAVVNLFSVYALGAMHEPEAAEARLLTGLEKTSEAEKAIRRVAEIYLS